MSIELATDRTKSDLAGLNSEEQVMTAWQSLMAETKDRPWLMRLWRKEGSRLLERFAQAYHSLLALSRQRRRALLRKAGTGLAGAALFLALTGGTPAFAETITMDGTCTLVDAITAANTDSPVGNCIAGSGADTIELTMDVTLTAVNNGNNGLPVVNSEITIDGNGHTISRDGGAPSFRILEVATPGNLTIDRATISGGHVGAQGAGIFVNNYAALTVNNSTITGNQTTGGSAGGGIMGNYGTTVTLNNSTVSGNIAGGLGGGVVAYGGFGGPSDRATLTINNSTITGNSANTAGGFWVSYGDATVTHSVISGNTASTANEVYSAVFGSTTITAANFNLFGHSGETNAQAFSNFTPSGSDINATSNGTNVALTSILNTALADNGGPTFTHALVSGSPAIDAIPTGSRMARGGDAVAAPPVLCTAGSTSYDQRGVFRANSPTDSTGTACDIGAFEFGQMPTAVTIAGFSSQTVWGSGPQLHWETASESGLSGFHIWRGSADGAETRLTDELIGASGGLNGSEYTWQDSASFGWGQRTYYWLEAVNADGSSSFTGPVEVLGIGRLFLPSVTR